jgi:hypothetical protein
MSHIDPWERIGECARAITAANDPVTRQFLINIVCLWIEVATNIAWLSDPGLLATIDRIHAVELMRARSYRVH